MNEPTYLSLLGCGEHVGGAVRIHRLEVRHLLRVDDTGCMHD
ncbi:MAG: hypothetical protein WKF82_04770 [Nocardioidaceae bacterium]